MVTEVVVVLGTAAAATAGKGSLAHACITMYNNPMQIRNAHIVNT